MSYSRRQIEALGEPLGDSVTRKEAGRIVYGGGGGGGPQQVTQTTSNIPDWMRPQVETLLGAGMQQLFETEPIKDSKGNVTGQKIVGMKSYTPYSKNPEDYVAGFNPLQQQVQANAANLQVPGQFNQATQLANQAGQGAMMTPEQAMMYGRAGYNSGMTGQGLGLQAYQNAAQQAGTAQGAAYGYGGQGAGYGAQAAGLAPQAQGYGRQGAGYGQTAADIGLMGLQAQDYGMGVGQQARNYANQAAMAGQQYAMNATDPNAIQAYMSPFQQNVVQGQLLEAQRQADIAKMQRKAQFGRAGALSGSARAIEDAEADRNLATQKNAIMAQGLQSAFQNAQQAQQFGSTLGLQGLAGAQAGLGTALQGGQLGLSGIGQAISGQQAGMQGAGVGLQGLGQAGQLYGLGMQGSGLGLQGVGQAINAGQLGLQGAGVGLQGTGQGMQGAGYGLQGVQGAQAGYGLGGNLAQILGGLGTQQLAGQTGVLNFQNQIGGQQQQQVQNVINQAISDYAQAQNYPMQQLNSFNSLLRGYVVPGQTATQYQAPPSFASQAAGLGVGAYGASQLAGLLGGGKKKGGVIKTGGIEQLAMRRALRGGKQ